MALYLFATFLVIPLLAPVLGREPVKETKLIKAHSFFTKLLNRNYVRPELNSVLNNTSIALNKKYPEIKLLYLDANFPFINKFPLLPHLSHNDGRKIDLSLIYVNKQGKLTNKKPSVSGYGAFVEPVNKEKSQTVKCKKKAYWQYDFTKYMTFGKINKDLLFSNKANRFLLKDLLKQASIQKIFIEPHLKTRMKLTHPKIRFHGCQAVRHDDHIHIQIK